jgi:transcription elongation factor Elf1
LLFIVLFALYLILDKIEILLFFYSIVKVINEIMTTKQRIENKFICAYCNKTYVRKSSYNTHLVKCKLCRFASDCGNSGSTNNANSSTINIDLLKKDLNIHNLFAMVIMLYNKYEKLESEYTELKKYVAVTKNKINILDYLNENFKHDYMNMDAGGNNITKFMDELAIGEDELQKIFKYDYVDGIFNIICDYIDKLNVKGSLLPIKCFNTKENILYIFDGELWLIMDDVYLRKFIKSFDKKILTRFVEWKKIAEKTIDTEIFGEIYIQNMKKVIGGNYEKKNPAFMIKNRLYKHFKIDLQSIVRYDFI